MMDLAQGTDMTDKILIVDFGSQVTQLIARRVLFVFGEFDALALVGAFVQA